MPKSAVRETYHYLVGSVGHWSAPVSRTLDERVRDTLIPRRSREAFVAAVRSAAAAGLTAGTLSEASIRLGQEKFAITTRTCRASAITEDDLTVAALHDRWVIGREELPRFAPLHRLFYRATAAGAVLLTQPVAALTIAARRLAPPAHLLADAAADVGDLICFDFQPGDDVLAETDDANWPAIATELIAIISERQALLLPGYGLLTWGNDLGQAVARAEACLLYTSRCV